LASLGLILLIVSILVSIIVPSFKHAVYCYASFQFIKEIVYQPTTFDNVLSEFIILINRNDMRFKQ